MPGFWNEAVGYYEGDRQGDDPAVPAPPGPGFAWDGSEWAYTLEACHAARLAAYPAIGDQLDALWKGGEHAEAMKAQAQMQIEQMKIQADGQKFQAEKQAEQAKDASDKAFE